MEELQLRVKNLPGALSGAAVTALLLHYGATRVKVLKHRRHDATQAAVAVFESQQTQQQALERLQRLELMRQKLKVEIVSGKSAQQSTQQQPETKAVVVTKQKPPPFPPGPPPPLVQIPTTPSPAPLAPHLGLNYAPSPLLVYKYPKATESIVRNMANALIALPKLYTQVLHLMNKMNLPPPFEDEAIPGIFSKRHEAAASKRQKRSRPGTAVPQQQLVEEEDDEDEEDKSKHIEGQQTQTKDQTGLKRQRTTDQNSLPTPLPAQLSLSAAPQRKHLVEKSKRVAVFSEDVGHAFVAKQDLSLTQARRPGVISKEELSRQTLSASQLLHEPKMANYKRGNPSSAVLVQNVTATADEKDLVYVFGHALPLAFPMSSLHVQLDRAAGTATIEFPDEQIAAAAVDEIHGVVLEGKPLIVRFYPQVVQETNDSETTASAEESVRIDAAALSQEKAMKNYQRGEPSSVLYVKNLAKTIGMNDLSAVFGSVLPATVDPDVLSIRHFTEGRMKFQAFVEFPSIELATSALEQTHGLLVQGKPLVVCFRKPILPTSAAP